MPLSFRKYVPQLVVSLDKNVPVQFLALPLHFKGTKVGGMESFSVQLIG